jgi:hypothetical protein
VRLRDRSVTKTPLRNGTVTLTGTAKGKNLRDALDELLPPHGLGWIMRDGKLWITSKAVQDEQRGKVKRLQKALPQVKELMID